MTYFIFAGDMLVMLFMVIVAIWVFTASSKEQLQASAEIPLNDEIPDETVHDAD